MSIRTRLIVMCLVVSLLPAIPISILVQTLLEKSFNVGLSETVEGALQSGVSVSREHLDHLHSTFERNVAGVIRECDTPPNDVETLKHVIERQLGSSSRIHGHAMRMLTDDGASEMKFDRLPRALHPFSADTVLVSLTQGRGPVRKRPAAITSAGGQFFETEDRSLQLAVWDRFLFFEETDPEFLNHANRLIEGRQIFARLKLTKPTLNRSFFYPFMIIYGVILLISLVLALLISERISNPIRRLAWGTKAVGAGDWNVRLTTKAGGEVGQLVAAFNEMVGRLDEQRQRLIDMEKMATWRDMARHLAHEIKNPLLPIRLTIQEVRDQYRGKDERYREILTESIRIVEDEINHLSRLVKEFSSFARMPDISLRMSSLDSLASDVAKMYPQLKTNIMSEPQIPEFMFDPDQLRIVFVNLFDNSLSVLGDRTDGAVEISLSRDAHRATIVYSDNGPGIQSDHLDRVFDPYFTTREEGTGLGLAMVKNIVLLHGGSIRVNNREYGGATFTIRIPTQEFPEPSDEEQ